MLLGRVLFWAVMVACSALTVACVYLAIGELGQPWGGFSLNPYGNVGSGYDTELVYFDHILAVNGTPVRSAYEIRAILQRTPPGELLTYQVARGQQTLRVTLPVQETTWQRLGREFGIPLLAALGQLCLGAMVFLLRPNTRRSWVFLGFCLAQFGLMVTFFDFASTYVFAPFFLLCWFMTSALFLHLALVFPEERHIVSRHPGVQSLLYLPSVVLWSLRELSSLELIHPRLMPTLVQVHAVYWGATLLFLLASLTYTAVRALSPVARRRAQLVLFGFAAGFILPVCGEVVVMIFRLNLPLEFFWPLTLFLPLSITYAILRYSLLDVGVMVRQTLTYSILTGMVIAGYVGLVWLSDTLLSDVVVVHSHTFPVLFSLVVLFGLNPLRVRLQHGLDRLFFRTRYDFRQTIEALSRDLTTVLDLDDIVGRIVHTVMSALGVSRAALYLADGSGAYRPLAAVGEAAERLASIQPHRDNPVVDLVARQRHGVSRYDLEADPTLVQLAPRAPMEFERLGVSLAFPIIFKDDLIGLLALGHKQSGAIFTAQDLDLLRTLTNQGAIAIANAHAYRALQEANAELRAALRKVELLEHIKMHLGKFVPASVRQIVERDPTAPALDKREQDVTVLFLDIAGYTSLSETLDQHQVNDIVERYFSSFLDDIYTNRGDINETAGDGLMIIFQGDDPDEHARAAVRTALAIRDKTLQINAELAASSAPVTVNMGINSGTAAVGSTRFESATGTRWTFTASGPVTNLAARIGASAMRGAIYIGAETARRLGGEIRLRDLGPQEFKNVREPVVVYEVLTRSARLEPVSA
jgi:class 3 adenylate cyclase